MVRVYFPQTYSLYASNGRLAFGETNRKHSRLKNTYTWNSIHCNFHRYAEQCIGW